ncbi:sensor histidine kinase [Actinomadura rubrisoli]|uniref:histidine kinase n=1 Tax=Actinomadura rubrisoli TaxID=2530368 RepID=A0A4R5C7N6_9ACTN|nr:HAMP domain-containing sensor histidine kinase [Actinomadura rubrisoli]TDD95821.1 HAMP domain-containing histidine kinase [Actinomadura rubrisoli]
MDAPEGSRPRRALRAAGRRARRPIRRLARTSLRARLLAITTALVAAGLAIGSGVVISALGRYQTDRVDDRLGATVKAMSMRPIAPDGEPDRAPDPQQLGPVFDVLGFSYMVFLRSDGSVARVIYSPGVDGRSEPRLPRLDSSAVARRAGRPFDTPGQGGSGRWRAIAVGLPAAAQSSQLLTGLRGGSLVVAAPRGDIDATLARMRATSLVTGGAVLAGLAVLGWFAIGAGLRPLRRIEGTAAAIAGGDLTDRVPDLAPPGSEIGRLSAALNGMLGQLEEAFAARAASETRMRRFVADVSHELRTPLSGIKGFTELYRMGGLAGPGETGRTMGRIEREAARLANLTEDLLLLARLDEHSSAGGTPPLDLSPMDLRTLAADAQHDVRALDPSRPIELTGPGGGPPAAAPVLGDEERLRQVVSNLVGNAVAHTPAGGRVRIGVGTRGGRAVLEIEDEGPGLAPEQAERIFDRFYRADRSRARGGTGGAGLGLAIARSLVTAHDGRIELDTEPGRGATFRVSLPVLEPTTAHPPEPEGAHRPEREGPPPRG